MPGIGDIIVVLLLCIAVFFAGRSVWRNHKTGGQCCGDCSRCSSCSGKTK